MERRRLRSSTGFKSSRRNPGRPSNESTLRRRRGSPSGIGLGLAEVALIAGLDWMDFRRRSLTPSRLDPWRDVAEPAPKVRYARSLREARPGELLWLDADGNVHAVPPIRSAPLGSLCSARPSLCSSRRPPRTQSFEMARSRLSRSTRSWAPWGSSEPCGPRHARARGVPMGGSGPDRERDSRAYGPRRALLPHAHLVRARVAAVKRRDADFCHKGATEPTHFARTFTCGSAAANRAAYASPSEEVVS